MNLGNSQHQIPLTPIDCVFVGPGSYPIEFAFFYEKAKFPLATMNLAWQRLANECPILKSRLKLVDGSYVFSWSEHEGPKPINWKKIDDYAHPDRHDSPYNLVDPVTTAPDEPLAALKITEGIDGATLGFSLSHAIADGFTYFMLLNAFTALARELSLNGSLPAEMPLPISHDRERFLEMAVSAPGPTFQENTNAELPGFSLEKLREDVPRHLIRYSKRHFSKNELDSLYLEFAEAPKRLSTNDMLCAGLWREFVRDFDSNPQNTLSLVAPVDFRRSYPDFPRNYAGNAVVLARVNLSKRKLLEDSLLDVALRIRNEVSSIDQRYICRTVACLKSSMNDDKYAGLGHVHIVDPNSGLLITNLSRMSFASLDFGVGAPTYCRPLTPCKRAIVLLSDGDDGVIAHINY